MENILYKIAVIKIQHLWAKEFYRQSHPNYYVTTKLINELTTYG